MVHILLEVANRGWEEYFTNLKIIFHYKEKIPWMLKDRHGTKDVR